MSLSPKIASTISQLPTKITLIEAKEMLRKKGYVKADLEGKLCDELTEAIEEMDSFFWSVLGQVGYKPEKKEAPFFTQLEKGSGFHDQTTLAEGRFKFTAEYIESKGVVANAYAYRAGTKVLHLENFGEEGLILDSLANIFEVMFKRSVLIQETWRVREGLSGLPYRDFCLYQKGSPNSSDQLQKVQGVDRMSHAFFLAADKVGIVYQRTLLAVWMKAALEMPVERKSRESFALQTAKIAKQYLPTKMKSFVENAWLQVGVLKSG